jgi:hypothetical protein
VPGARRHADQGAQLTGSQRQGGVDARRAGGGEVAGQGVGDAVRLVRVHPDQAVGRDQLVQVAGGRRHDQQDAVRAQDAVELGAVAGREDVQDHRRRVVRQRERLPQVGQDGSRPGMGAGRPPQGRLRHVQADPDRSGQGVQDVREVETGAGPGVDHQLTGGRGVGEGGGDDVVVTGGEEGGAVLDHRGGVAVVRGATVGQGRVPLAGQIEAVPPRTAQRPSLRAPRQRPGAHRAAKVRQCCVDHRWHPSKVL